MEKNIKVNEKMEKEKGEESIPDQVDQNMKENEFKISPMEWEDLLMQMGNTTKGNDAKERQRAKVYIRIFMELDMKGNERTAKCMEKELRNGKMAPSMKGNTIKTGSIAKESSFLQMGPDMKVTSPWIIYMVMEATLAKKEFHMRDSEAIIRCTGKAHGKKRMGGYI